MFIVAYAPAVVQDLSSPDKTLAALVAAFSSRDTTKLAACLAKSVPADQLAVLFKGVPANTKLTFEVASTTVDKQTDTEATLTAQFKVTVEPAPPQPIPLSPKEVVNFQKVGADWKIVAPKEMPRSAGIANAIAFLAEDPQRMGGPGRAPDGPPPVVALSNFKQIALGCLMYSQDYDGVFKFTAAGFKKEVQPYIKSMAVFHSPLDKPGVDSARLNPALANVAVVKVKAPAQTVLLFEGEPGKPLFRYTGKAIIGFVDGHCKLVTPDEAKTLRWKP